MMRRPLPTTLLIALSSLVLAGCADDMSDLRAYVEKTKQRPGQRVPPIPEFEPYQSFTYLPDDLRDPFRVQASFAEPEQTTAESTTGLKPDLDRRREPLESYALDGLDMVGTLSRGGDIWALIRDPDPDAAVHQVKEGNYLGQNHGRITGVYPDKVTLVEIIPDGQGGWMERDAAIAMSQE